MKRLTLLVGIISIVLASCAFAGAQQPPPGQAQGQGQGQGPGVPRQRGLDRQPGSPPPPEPFDDAMFPPEMIMQHQRELALTDDQKTFMRSEIQRTTTRFNELQWQLQDAMEALHETMKAPQVNEQQALAQLNKVLDAEREIKTLHMGMAIRIKNKLTPEQQMKLQTMRRPRRDQDGPDMGPGPGRGPGRRPGGPGGPDGPGGPRPGGGQPRPGGPPNFQI